jgi:parvulin-like peptidyl-prolyl isomerase
MLGPTLARYSVVDLTDLLGADLARRVFELPPGAWQGPFRTAEGVHFLRVVTRHPARVPAFEEVVEWLRQDWRHARQQELIDAQLAALRERYRIVVEAGEASR